MTVSLRLFATLTGLLATSLAFSQPCTQDNFKERLVCQANAFEDTLSHSQRQTLELSWNNKKAKTTWSNLPNVQRNGLRLGDLSDASYSAAIDLIKTALSEQGYQDFVGVLAADDYLNSLGGSQLPPPQNGGPSMPMNGSMPPPPPNGFPGGTPPNGPGVDQQGMPAMYSSGNYYIAFIGQPSVNTDWMLQVGGHHLAYNITYTKNGIYPTPNHIGIEPKSQFEINGVSYAPLKSEGDAMLQVFNALTSKQKSQAYLNGEVYTDVLVGPDNGSEKRPDDYPEGASRKGVRVSQLNDKQKALVKNAIAQWVDDYPQAVSAPLMKVYTSSQAFADTYLSWADDGSFENNHFSGDVDVDKAETYMRIDGPRLWIELVCQNGVVVSKKTHYHSMFRDKKMDYGNTL